MVFIFNFLTNKSCRNIPGPAGLFTSDWSGKTNVKMGDLWPISWNDIFNISQLDNYETIFKIWRAGKTLKMVKLTRLPPNNCKWSLVHGCVALSIRFLIYTTFSVYISLLLFLFFLCYWVLLSLAPDVHLPYLLHHL